MRKLIGPEVERAALALGLDVATAEAFGRLEDNGIAAVLLKGPAVARYLYADESESRTYLDVDLLVDPTTFVAAERVLESLGYGCQDEDLLPREKAWLMETSWERAGSPPTNIDLHRGFHGVGDWPAWWGVISSHAVECRVGGRSVKIPDAAGCALVVTLHDTAVGRTAQSAEDLHRALERFDAGVWEEAARRAAAVDSLASFTLGVCHHEAGRQLAQTLGLPRELPLEVAARARAGPGTDSRQLGLAWMLVHRLGQASTWRERVVTLWDVLFPSAGILRASRPLAARGRVGLALARVGRPLELAARTPGVLREVWLGYRRSRDPNRPS